MKRIELKNKTVFITGSAGFIGSNLILELLRTQSPVNIIGLDNMNSPRIIFCIDKYRNASLINNRIQCSIKSNITTKNPLLSR